MIQKCYFLLIKLVYFVESQYEFQYLWNHKSNLKVTSEGINSNYRQKKLFKQEGTITDTFVSNQVWEFNKIAKHYSWIIQKITFL